MEDQLRFGSYRECALIHLLSMLYLWTHKLVLFYSIVLCHSVLLILMGCLKLSFLAFYGFSEMYFPIYDVFYSDFSKWRKCYMFKEICISA